MFNMDSDFLKEYESREIEALKRGKGIDIRIGHVKSPISYLIPDRPELIWSQVAFSGTVIFPLHPYPENIFGKDELNSSEEISHLIQFVKETKKIQFVLTALPTKYESLEYLEPILEEFLPPSYTRYEGDKKFHEVYRKCEAEITHLIKFSPEWKTELSSIAGKALMTSNIRSYAVLRHLGFNDIGDIFIDHFLTEPEFCKDYITTAYNLLCHPIIDPLKANPSFSHDTIQKAMNLDLTSYFSSKSSVFPEVGSYLLKKCTHYPESLDACKQLIAVYEQNDLYDVYSALNNAVIDRNESIIFEKKNEMNEILDNVWEDNTIEKSATAIRTGVDITCGTIGYCLGGPTEGLLASLGLRVIDRGNYIGQFSELISRKLAYPYMSTIYDFKKKYSIK